MDVVPTVLDRPAPKPLQAVSAIWYNCGMTDIIKDDELYLATKALFGYLTRFDDIYWADDYRPVLNVSHVGCRDDDDDPMFDILRMSQLGSYIRERAAENNDQPRFKALQELCTRHLFARRNHYAQYVREHAS